MILKMMPWMAVRVTGPAIPCPSPPAQTRHWRAFQEGKATSTNPIASLFAWTRGLAHRAKLDNNAALLQWCEDLEAAVLRTVEMGHMTKDLAVLVKGGADKVGRGDFMMTEPFLDTVRATFEDMRCERCHVGGEESD